MQAFLIAISLFAATPSPSAPVVSPQLLVGAWRVEEGGTYHFLANGTFSWRAADMDEGGRWKLRDGHTLELRTVSKQRQIIAIDRVVHETLYVRTPYQREVWLKQPGP